MLAFLLVYLFVLKNYLENMIEAKEQLSQHQKHLGTQWKGHISQKSKESANITLKLSFLLVITLSLHRKAI